MDAYVYNDEDNNPMLDPFDGPHNPTVYGSRAEMKAVEKGEIPFSERHPEGCWNCLEYDGNHCMKEWNNADPIHYIPERDDKEPDDYCDDWREYKNALWDDYFTTGEG